MNANLLATPEVWMEGEALAQLERAASLPGCLAAAGLPDLHPGPGGMPIGVALAFDDVIYPGLLGSDVGCGVRAVVTELRRPALDRLERRLRAVVDAPLTWPDPAAVLDALRTRGIRGLAELDALPSSLCRAAEAELPREPLPASDLPPELLDPVHAETLGTIGGGNHFAEVSHVSEVAGTEGAEQALVPGRVAVLVHSGSRSLGHALAGVFGAGRLAARDAAGFLAAQAWACRFAEANRFIIGWRLLAAADAARPDRHRLSIDCVHNEVVHRELEGRALWLHRKGAAPAERGRLTVVLGTRGDSSHLMRGNGSVAGLESVAHGAGRRLTRAQALGRMREKHQRASLARTKLNSRVLCARTEMLYEEHPDAYKPVGPVVAAVVARGLATPVATLTPLVTVKA